ncbi:uncharacterized protein LOC144203090 [Stigmatopora nigra]
MDGTLDGASVLCVFKLVCGLVCLPSLATSRSPVAFCACCILIFTDFLLAVCLSLLGIFESWLSIMPLPVDVVALRFLLFLSYLYATVLMLLTPLVAAEMLSRHLWLTRGKDGDEEEREKACLFDTSGYLCCLSAWAAVALSLRCQCRLEDARTVACLGAERSLMCCLPSLLGHRPAPLRPCWDVALLCLVLVLLTCLLLFRARACQGKEGHATFPPGDARQGPNLPLALLAVLGALVLPVYLGVNVLLLRSVETLLEACISYFLACSPQNVASTAAVPV